LWSDVLLAILLGRRVGLSFDLWRFRFGWRRRSSSLKSRRRFPWREEMGREESVLFERRRKETRDCGDDEEITISSAGKGRMRERERRKNSLRHR